jgi:hypothetical protein
MTVDQFDHIEQVKQAILLRRCSWCPTRSVASAGLLLHTITCITERILALILETGQALRLLCVDVSMWIEMERRPCSMRLACI